VFILHQGIMHHMVTLNMDLHQEPILLHMVAIRLRALLHSILTKDTHLQDTLLWDSLHRVVILHRGIMHHMVTICLWAPLQCILIKGSPQGMELGHFLLGVQQRQLQLMVLTN